MVMRLKSFVPYLFFAVLITVAVACAPVAPVSSPSPAEPTPAPDAAPPPAPDKPDLTVEPGTTKVTATWNAVIGADSYLVRWRHRKTDFADDSLITVTEPTATFTVEYQGAWIVRVVACNDHGCGRGGNATVPVIINIPGREAVRYWHNEDGYNLDWDALPGYYLVKYRTSVDNTKWKSSPPLSEIGFTITGDDLADFSLEKGIGHPVIRVYFNCDSTGERCDFLGRNPNTTIQELPVFTEPPPNPYATAEAAAAGQSATPEKVRDPITWLWRPASDFTITTETRPDDDITYTCLARPSENRWEEANFGPTVKDCDGWKFVVTDHYVLDPDAVFPGGARCGERAPENEHERRDFGDTVKVCNDRPDEKTDDETSPDGGARIATHENSHSVHWASLDWPAQYAQSYGPLNVCKDGFTTNPGHQRYIHLPDYQYETKITVNWCYRYRSHVDKVQTLSSKTITTIPDAGDRKLYKIQFCGWQLGKIDYSPGDERYPYETLWHYVHPTVNAYLPWGYTSKVTPWYGNVGEVERDRLGYIQSITKPCNNHWC